MGVPASKPSAPVEETVEPTTAPVVEDAKDA